MNAAERNSNYPRFAIADVVRAVECYRAKGVTIDDYIEETPAFHMAFAQDSEGNAFILHRRKNARAANESVLRARLTTA